MPPHKQCLLHLSDKRHIQYMAPLLYSLVLIQIMMW